MAEEEWGEEWPVLEEEDDSELYVEPEPGDDIDIE